MHFARSYDYADHEAQEFERQEGRRQSRVKVRVALSAKGFPVRSCLFFLTIVFFWELLGQLLSLDPIYK